MGKKIYTIKFSQLFLSVILPKKLNKKSCTEIFMVIWWYFENRYLHLTTIIVLALWWKLIIKYFKNVYLCHILLKTSDVLNQILKRKFELLSLNIWCSILNYLILFK